MQTLTIASHQQWVLCYNVPVVLISTPTYYFGKIDYGEKCLKERNHNLWWKKKQNERKKNPSKKKLVEIKYCKKITGRKSTEALWKNKYQNGSNLYSSSLFFTAVQCFMHSFPVISGKGNALYVWITRHTLSGARFNQGNIFRGKSYRSVSLARVFFLSLLF